MLEGVSNSVSSEVSIPVKGGVSSEVGDLMIFSEVGDFVISTEVGDVVVK